MRTDGEPDELLSTSAIGVLAHRSSSDIHLTFGSSASYSSIGSSHRAIPPEIAVDHHDAHTGSTRRHARRYLNRRDNLLLFEGHGEQQMASTTRDAYPYQATTLQRIGQSARSALTRVGKALGEQMPKARRQRVQKVFIRTREARDERVERERAHEVRVVSPNRASVSVIGSGATREQALEDALERGPARVSYAVRNVIADPARSSWQLESGEGSVEAWPIEHALSSADLADGFGWDIAWTVEDHLVRTGLPREEIIALVSDVVAKFEQGGRDTPELALTVAETSRNRDGAETRQRNRLPYANPGEAVGTPEATVADAFERAMREPPARAHNPSPDLL